MAFDDLWWKIYEERMAPEYDIQWNTLRAKLAASYGELERCAMEERAITYGTLASKIFTDPRRYLGIVLQTINYIENEHNQPLLGVLVVREDTRLPGSGFYEQIEELGTYDTDKWSRENIFIEERNRVFNRY